MPQATYHFPRGFLWGTATAAHQVEGNNTNNQWWEWEQEGHTKGQAGRGLRGCPEEPGTSRLRVDSHKEGLDRAEQGYHPGLSLL